MAPMDEPTTAEMVRTLSAQISAVAASTARIESVLTTFVTQEQRAADKELTAEREAQQSREIARLDQKATFVSRTLWTVVMGPLFVGLLLWIFTEGGTAA